MMHHVLGAQVEHVRIGGAAVVRRLAAARVVSIKVLTRTFRVAVKDEIARLVGVYQAVAPLSVTSLWAVTHRSVRATMPV